MALRYFFDLSSTAQHFQSNHVNDLAFLQAFRDYRHFIEQKASGILEIERFTALYRGLAGVFNDIWSQKIIKQGEKTAAVRGLTIGQTNYASDILRVFAKLIHENAIEFEKVSVEADYFSSQNAVTIGGVNVPRNMKSEV